MAKQNLILNKNIAAVLSITIITAGIMSCIIVTQPKAVTAVKNTFRLLNVQNNESDAISFSLKEADNFNIELPQSFSKSLYSFILLFQVYQVL